jgi:Protein of unknown function (DUF4197)
MLTRLAGRLSAGFFCLALAVAPAAAGGKLDNRTATSGLKEALSQGAGKAVGLLGQPDGYLGNNEVRIPMPEKLKTVDRGLRTVGRGDLVEAFVTSMNRAAEAAVPVAKPVFLNAIKSMTIQDALSIVRGKDHQATDYLRETTGPRLSELFAPIVGEKLDAVGATRSFDALVKRYAALPLTGKPTFDLRGYVTGKALDGLFLMIAREEENIRTNPVARTTDLLRKVFGADRQKTPWWKIG